jgi:hypothetical protein
MTKALALLLLSSALLQLSPAAEVPAPGAKPKSPLPAKLTAHDIHVLPFAQEHASVKFKATSREFPSEPTVTVTDKIHFYGKRRSDASPMVRGTPTGNIGQVALFPPGDRKGILTVKKAFGPNMYFVVFELPEDTLNSKQMPLKEGKAYTWTAKSENGTTTIRVLGPDGTEVGSNSGPTEKILSLGFAGTLRNQGNELDMTITYEQ